MTQYIGIYPVIRKLGEGGMGKIYLVQDPEDGSFWAAKEFKGDLSRPLLVQRFRREFRALQALHHPAIVQVKNLEYSQNNLFFLMEYVHGTSLDQLLVQPRVRNMVWIRQVLAWVRYLCEPLDYIHGQNMIHRDLKPGNIMIIDSNEQAPLKLLDFGVVHWSLADSVVTGKPAFFGSLRYMAPEQIGSEIPDRRSDLYSIGVILYEALTGKPPFAVDNPLLLMNLHQTGDPVPPRKLNVYISDNLQSMILALLFKRPDDRPASAAELADWIDQILGGREFHAVQTKPAVSSKVLFHPEFIGRENEIRLLLKAWHKTRNGSLQVCNVSGTAGIGKSRLIKQLFRMPDLSVNPVCKGDFQVNSTVYSGFVKALKNGLNDFAKRYKYTLPALSDTYTHLKNEFLETIDLLELKSEIYNKSSTVQEKSSRIWNLLTKLTNDRPLILILDDLHNAVDADFQLLKSLIEMHLLNQDTNDTKGFFIVLGYRFNEKSVTDALQSFVDWQISKDFTVNCPLDGLSSVSVKNMVQSMMGGSSAPALANSVYPGSNGNPLYIIEKVKEIVDSKPDIKWQDMLDDDATIVGYDESLNDVLARRMDTIRKYANEVLVVSAVLGNSFRAEELEQVCNLSDATFLDQVDYLIRHQILEEDPTQRDSYRFTHTKLMESVLNSLSETESIEIHCRSLEILENIHAENLKYCANRLLKHAYVCKIDQKIFTYHILAAENLNKSDQINALKHLEKALKLYSDKMIDTDLYRDDYLKAQILMGSLLRRTGDIKRSEKLLKKSLKELEHLTLDGLVAQTHMQLGALYGRQGKIAPALEHLNTALALFNKLNDKKMIINCYINIGASYNLIGDYSNLGKYSALAIEKADAVNDHESKVRAMINLGVSYHANRDYNNTRSYLERALELAEVHNIENVKGYCLMVLATCYLEEAENEENSKKRALLSNKTLAYIERTLKSLKKTGDLALMGDCFYKRARSRQLLGKPFSDDIDRAVNIYKKTGQSRFLNEVLKFKAQVSAKGG
jgi:serine/threonine protein kinase/tetratricopeptide (TPR) repeat protein